MVRQNEQVTPAVDPAYEQMWDRASQRQQRGIEERFVESLGADLIAEAEAAQSAGTPERFAQLGRWVTSAWVSYRNEQLERLRDEGMLR